MANKFWGMDRRVKPGDDNLDDSGEASVLRGGLGGREFAGDAAVPLELLCLDAEFRRQHAQPAGHRKVEGGAGEVQEGIRLPEQVIRGHGRFFRLVETRFFCVIYQT